MGAHGTVEAIMPSTTAVVPQEQNGVPTATPVDRRTLFLALRRRKRAMASWSMYSFNAALMRMLITSSSQLCENVSTTLPNVNCRRELISILTFEVYDLHRRALYRRLSMYFRKKISTDKCS